MLGVGLQGASTSANTYPGLPLGRGLGLKLYRPGAIALTPGPRPLGLGISEIDLQRVLAQHVPRVSPGTSE